MAAMAQDDPSADSPAEPALLTEAEALIRGQQYDAAVEKLMAGLAELDLKYHSKAYRYAGLAFYFSERWAEALGMFQVAANGSEVPEDWFNVAMAQVKLGWPAGAKETWQKVHDLSYAHQDAPESSTFFQKKLIFAQALQLAGACDGLGLDLVERQLMGFYLNNRITDVQFWVSRGVPAFGEVMETTRDYYRAMGKTEAEWGALCDRVAAAVDEDGKAYCAVMKTAGFR
jgi:tetratricopeptide (TPR) repeat protein